MSREHTESLQVDAIRSLTGEIPLNDFGLPTGIYRTDLLPFHDYEPANAPRVNGAQPTPLDPNTLLLNGTTEEEEEDTDSEFSLTSVPHDPNKVYRIAGFPARALHGAFMPLQFDEGFPAFNNGQPFWARLDYEPADAFEAFQKYLQMSFGRASTLEGEGEDEEYDGSDATGTRNISTLTANLFPDNQLLMMTQKYQEYYHLYYWGMRAHAYDLYRIVQYRTQQELRAVETQDEHYVQTRRLRHRLMQYMNDEEDFWDMMTPKTGIDMFKTITSLERVSAGLPAGGPISDANEAIRGQPFEVTMRTVAQTNRRVDKNIISEEGEVLDKALEDPAATEILQELIIKTGGY